MSIEPDELDEDGLPYRDDDGMDDEYIDADECPDCKGTGSDQFGSECKMCEGYGAL